jgi:hypothetical protein
MNGSQVSRRPHQQTQEAFDRRPHQLTQEAFDRRPHQQTQEAFEIFQKSTQAAELESGSFASPSKPSQINSPPARAGQIRWSPSSPSSASDGSPVRDTVDEGQTQRLLAEARQAVADTSIRDYARKQCNVSGVLEAESPKRTRRFAVESMISTPSTIWAAAEDRVPEPAEVCESDAIGLSLHGELLSDTALHKLQDRLKQHADSHVVGTAEVATD